MSLRYMSIVMRTSKEGTGRLLDVGPNIGYQWTCESVVILNGFKFQVSKCLGISNQIYL